jgi:translocation and assembly module TamB
MTVTLADGKTHIQGKIQLHDSTVNLDDMPLHQGTSTSDDEIIMNEQGQPISKEKAVSNLSYDVKIGFADKVQVNVQNSELFLGGELQLVQTTENPEMQAFGKVKLRKGHINLDSSNQIQIDESSFIFSGVIANPALDVNLYRVVDQTTARLNITGNASQPQFVFYSKPALSQGRIINLLVFGRSGDMSKEPNYESQVLSAFYKLGIQNNTPVLNTLTSSLGIQDVYFDVQGQKVSSLLVGRALTDKLYIRYAKDLTGQQNNAVQLFYQLTNKWLLKTNSGNENSSVDVIYRIERK